MTHLGFMNERFDLAWFVDLERRVTLGLIPPCRYDEQFGAPPAPGSVLARSPASIHADSFLVCSCTVLVHAHSYARALYNRQPPNCTLLLAGAVGSHQGPPG